MTADRFNEWRHPEIQDGTPTKYGWIVRHIAGFTLGERTDTEAFTCIQAQQGVTLEDEVQIGSDCSICPVSTIDDEEGLVLLLRNVRVGCHSVIMSGVTIGEHAVVGASVS